MSYASLHRLHADDTDDVLVTSNDLVERAGIVGLIQDAAAASAAPVLSLENRERAEDHLEAREHTVVPIGEATRRRKGGAPARLPQYTTDMPFKVTFEMAWRGDSFSWANFAFALWYRYTDVQLALIGHGGWRDPARAEAMRPAAMRSVGPGGPARARVLSGEAMKRLKASELAWHAEVSRAHDQVKRLLAPIDDTPLPAARRHTLDATRQARTPSHDAARDLRRLVQNRLVGALLEQANEQYYPDVRSDDLFAGLLRDFKGDVGIDEHNVVVSTAYGQRTAVRSSKSLARYAKHVRREQEAMAIGLTAAIAVSRPEAPQVPPILVAFDLHDASSEAALGARNTLSVMEKIGLRPPLAGRGHQYVVTDKAYPRYVGFGQHLLAHKWTILGKYVTATENKQGAAPYADMAPPDATAPGPFQFNGAFLCPGIGADYLYAHRGFDIPHDRDVSPEWLARNDAIVRQLSAAVMRSNGRPKPRKHSRRGRPSATAKPLANQWTVEVLCPASGPNPKVRCPRVSTSMELPEGQFPKMQHAPGKNDPAPKCCTSDFGSMQLVLTEKNIANWQDKMAGSWEHQDFYSPARNTTEAFFGRLMDRKTGDLTLGRIEWQRNAFVSLAITASVLATNKRVIDKWEANLQAGGDVPPAGRGPARRALRERMRNK